MKSRYIFHLANEEATQLLAGELVNVLSTVFTETRHYPFKMYLHGSLGAGKTTFSRYFIRALGYEKAVKSPTYTLIEPYEFAQFTLFHADLYRLSSPLELYDLGFLEEGGVWLIEWPEKGEGVLPEADLMFYLERKQETLTLTIMPNTSVETAICQSLATLQQQLAHQ